MASGVDHVRGDIVVPNETSQSGRHGPRRDGIALHCRTPAACDATFWDERRETRKQLLRFLVVGSTSVAVDFAVYRALVAALWPWDIAKGASYMAGVVVGFFGNKCWMFESSRRSAAEPVSYLVLYAITLAVNVACNRAALIALGDGAGPWAFVFATGVTTVLNFLGMKLVTFRRGVDDRRAETLREAA